MKFTRTMYQLLLQNKTTSPLNQYSHHLWLFSVSSWCPRFRIWAGLQVALFQVALAEEVHAGGGWASVALPPMCSFWWKGWHQPGGKFPSPQGEQKHTKLLQPRLKLENHPSSFSLLVKPSCMLRLKVKWPFTLPH